MDLKKIVNAIGAIEENNNISTEIIIDALSEGLKTAYYRFIDVKKDSNLPKPKLRVDVTKKEGIKLYHIKTVVEEVNDDELELQLNEIKSIYPDAEIGDEIEEEVNIKNFGRKEISNLKNVFTQKIKEAHKKNLLDKYKDKVDDIVNAVVESVEDKFVLVKIDDTDLALLAQREQIPYEKYYDGQRLKVIIKEVSDKTKGAPITVSRASKNLVKRLFEQTVSEIYDGTVEIKGIARVANSRTKMAVYSKDPNVDAIGACIGNRGSRVSAVISEIRQQDNSLTQESIDIIEWSDDYIEYVKNVMKPASIIGVIPKEDTIQIVVEDDQLSLAIGRKGINAQLASELLSKKVDIKTAAVLEEAGVDWQAEMAQYIAKEKEKRLREAERKAAELAKVEAERKAKELEAYLQQKALEAEMEEIAVETVETSDQHEETVETTSQIEEEVIVETIEEVEETVEETIEETEEEIELRKARIAARAAEYVSKFESLADASKDTEEDDKKTSRRKRRETKEEIEARELKERLEQLKKQDYEIKPEYTEEELEEFENPDEDFWYYDDIDFDEYDEFYDED
ncbi:MAG: transcription termination factor NusA [Bacillota bacterium]|mgnify:CR=1 FL=1|jgi:N utilization substance protein A|nr:transcription termination factor NusA [Bacillota bacterium]NLL26383.1 transcription termination factor NusA [Erysipelotrichia bacterium]